MEYQASSATLSNGHNFTGKTTYDDVFGAPPKFGVHSFASGIEDYSEIFGGSRASIPVLDVPALKEPKVSVDVRSSKLDYSKIFGGFGDSDFAVPHEELLAEPKREQSFSDKAWTPAETRSPLVGSEPPNFSEDNNVCSHEASYQSLDGVKRFNMLYHKTNQRSKNGTNGTTHIAQLHAMPGYTCLIDDISALHLTEGMKAGKHCRKVMSGLPPGGASKQTSGGGVKFQNKSSWNRSISNDKLFDAYEFGLGTHSSSLPNFGTKGSVASKFGVSKSDASEGGAGVYSPPYFDEEVDANSVAAASAAAVRKAIEEAQARIRIAKEIMERNKGLQSRVKPSFKDGLRAEERREGKIADESNRLKEEAQKKSEQVDSAGTGQQSTIKADQVTPDFMDSEELFTAEEAVEETHGLEFVSTQGDHTQEKLEEWEAAKQFYEIAKSGKHRAMTLEFEQGEDAKKIMQSIDKYEWKRTKTASKSFEKIVENGKKSKEPEEARKREEIEKKLDAVKGAQEWEECPIKVKSAQEVHDQEENELKFEVTQEQKETEKKLKASHEQEKREGNLKELQEPMGIEKKLEVQELEENLYMKRLKEANEWENEEKQEKALEKAENENISKNKCEKEQNEGRLEEICGQEENGKIQKEACEGVEYEEKSEASKWEENKKEQMDAHQGEDTEKSLDKVHVQEVMEDISSEFHNSEESEKRLQEEGESEETEMLKDVETNVKIVEETCKWVETERIQTEINQSAEHEKKMKATQEALKYQQNNLDATDGACNQDDNENENDNQESCRHEENDKDVEMTPEILAHEENGTIGAVNKASFGPRENENESEPVEVGNDLEVKGIFDTAGSQGSLELNEIERQMKEAIETLCFNKIGVDVRETDMNFGQKQIDQHEKSSKIVCNLGQHVGGLVRELEEDDKDVEESEIANNQEEDHNNFESHEERWIDNEENLEAAQLPSMFEEKGKPMEMDREIKTSQSTENNEENHHETLTIEESETKDTSEQEVELDEEHLKKINEAKEREREREKERIAVERAIREARERAFAEARERAERAAVERAASEARRRVMAEANDKSSSEKASMEAKLKAERAAVERATAEARERALEKALSDKAAFEARNQAEKFVAEKFSGSSRDYKKRHSFTSYDAQHNGSSSSSSSRCPNSSNHGVPYSTEKFDGANSESAERCEARSERHQRIVERAEKALADKNKRDLLAQKEQAERNKLAEALDADVKRWSSGKEKSLRALLSTLQYILGPDSGWQPIPLTDIVATTAVKKAYRKATLCVHPDKLQQRGASIQQKYKCEKVFDLLKEAWNKFSAEER